MCILALLTLCIAATTAIPGPPQKIFGGSVTTIERYPTIASLLYTKDWVTFSQDCGAIILNNRSVLTVAQCSGHVVSRYRLRLGSTWANTGGVVHNVNQIIVHPAYNFNTHDSDIAILRSATVFSFNNNVRAAFIAGSNYNIADNQAVWAAGWGRHSTSALLSEQLRHVEMVTINHDACRINYLGINMRITDNMLCVGWPGGGRGQCLGDFGGPLYQMGVVVGIGSFGVGCGVSNFPSVNVRVSRFTSWIELNA